jgi:hypothetical protein
MLCPGMLRSSLRTAFRVAARSGRAGPCRSAAICAALGCAHPLSQDATTGPDGWPTGAVSIALVRGGAASTGVGSGTVSYPAGDRVDWKRIDLPPHQAGTLALVLTWQSMGGNDRLGFDVFDSWGAPVVTRGDGSADPTGDRSQIGRIDHARGSYLVRVYAVDRRDAGDYQLAVEFAPNASGPGFDPITLAVPDPPRLPEVPVDPVCDDRAYDPANPACANKCPTPADVRIVACQATMPCPSPPDRRVAACSPSAWPACDLAHRDRGNPNCDHASSPPVIARILRTDLRSGDSDVFVTIGAGKQQGLSLRWTARVVRGDDQAPLPGGAITLVRVDDKVTYGKVKLTSDQLQHDTRVELLPPTEP